MAIVKRSETTSTLTQTDRLPKQRYSLRCLKEEFGPSKSSGNLMITRKWEIVSPETIEINGKQVEIAGVELNPQYVVIRNNNPDGTKDVEKSNKSIGRFLNERHNLGLNAEEVDDEAPPLDLEGKIVDAICDAEESVMRERSVNGKPGKEILDANGNKIVRYYPKVVEILGMSSVQVNRPY